MLSGNKNIDTIILNNLDDKDLIRICHVNKYLDSICKDQIFWLNRILYKFPYLSINILNKYRNGRLWSDYYIYDLRKINKLNAQKYLYGPSIVNMGRIDHLMIAIANGADIHQRNDGLLRYASREGNLELVKILVEMGANPRASDIRGVPDAPIRWAHDYGHSDVVNYLLTTNKS